MDIIKYRQIKRRVRTGGTFQAAEVKELVEIIQQQRKFIDNLLAYSFTGHSVLINNVYDMRDEALRIVGLIERS